jgi:hypothetical protein
MSKSGKVGVAKKTMKDPELIDLFNQMCGAGEPDPNIVVPKYEKLLEEAKKITNMLLDFSRSPFAKVFRSDYNTAFDEIANYATESLKELDELTLEENKNDVLSGEDLKGLNENQSEIAKYIASINSKYDLDELKEAYGGLKECRPIQEAIMMTRNIKDVLMMEKERRKTQKHDLEERDALSLLFITKCEGDSLTLFQFSSLDFKQITYNEDFFTPDLKKYVLLFLHLLYKKGLEIVRLITAPDIDVDKFSEVLVRNIGEVRKRIPRCDKAFDKIANSVNLLRGNFDDYYKDFVISQNPGIIIENFVGDVAKDSSADVQTTMQFRQIIKFYKQQMAGKVNDPKVKKILSMVGANLDVLEQETKSYEKEKKDDEPPEPERDMSDPKVRQEVADSFLPDYVKSQSAEYTRGTKKKGNRKPAARKGNKK